MKPDPRRKVPVVRDETPQEAMRSALQDGRTRQHPLLVVATILPGHEPALRKVLYDIDYHDVEDNYILPFARLRTVHFARFVVHDAAPTAAAPRWRDEAQVLGPDIPAKLLFSTDFDGAEQAHLEELVEKVGTGLDAVFEHCEGYPAAGSRTPERVIRWMKRRRVRTNTFYTGTMNRSVLQIRREAMLHRAIDEFIDGEGLRAIRPDQALAARERIQRFVTGRPDLEWARIPPGPSPGPIISQRLRSRPLPLVLGAVAAVAALVALGLWLAGQSPLMAVAAPLLGIAALGAVGYGLFRLVWSKLLKLEAADRVIVKDGWQDRARTLLAGEDKIVQNELSSVIYIKEPLWFRGPLLKLVLFATHLSARYLSNTGNLGGIPSIHFGRWVVVDDGRRLVFFSNFDGSWQNYLGDFVDKSAGGVTSVWSNCVGFPRTRGLTGGGARDEQIFKQYARQSQIPTQVWYSAYKWLSVENVNNNSKIRLGLDGEMTGDQAQAWLRRFGGKPGELGEAAAAAAGEASAPAQTEPVELDDVQGLVVRSFARLEHATYLPLRFGDPAGARRWIGALEPQVTRASQRSDAVAASGEAVAVGFTSDGLQALGLGEQVRRTFTVEFQEGMAWSGRSRVLGDIDEAAPEFWRWGGTQNPVHAMLLLYAASADGLKALCRRERARAEAEGVVLLPPLPSETLPRDKEHFGFNDGIAQPRVRGFNPARGDEGAVPGVLEIPTGEVLLGYANAYGQIPDSPWVSAESDPGNLLPAPPQDADREDQAPRHDLGKNGTYLVFRQLEQDVKGFWSFLDRRTRQGGAPDPARRKQLAAKMVGRWPNGAPLVLFPDAEPQGYDPRRDGGDRFMYVTRSADPRDGGDPHGDKCPLGSHIRRTNPRDGMQTGPAESMTVADRHRMLRRGRAYGPPLAASFDPDDLLAAPDDGVERGLHFICFGTDIVRQFEFVQSTWVHSGKFDGLYADPDPIVARHCKPKDAKDPEQVSHFTEHRCPVRHRERVLEPFVTMRGGAYFFIPGVAALRYLASL